MDAVLHSLIPAVIRSAFAHHGVSEPSRILLQERNLSLFASVDRIVVHFLHTSSHLTVFCTEQLFQKYLLNHYTTDQLVTSQWSSYICPYK